MRLTAKGVVFSAGGKRLVDGVSAGFDPGRLHFVIGPNGAGKSTFLKILSGQLHAAAGEVRFGDHEVRELGLAALARMRAVLSQSVEVAFPLRVREVVMMGRYPHFLGRPAAEDERICDEVVQLFDLAGMERRDFLTLSGGEQQRVHFARVLAQVWSARPGYLLLDEPLRSLDVFHQLDFLRKLQALREKGLVIVVVVHDLDLAAGFADELLLLRGGKVVAAGAPERVLTRENIEAAFAVAPLLLPTPGGRMHVVFE